MLPRLLCCCLVVGHAAAVLPPDNTGLVGVTPETDNPLTAFKFWPITSKSPVKPRKKDLHEATLMHLMGQDFDPRWMRQRASQAQMPLPVKEEDRPAVQRLHQLSQTLSLPESLAAELRATVRAWLVSRASCPIRFEWTDLGYAFWPRWVRRGECGDGSDGSAASPGPKRRRFYADDDSDEDDDDGSEAPQSDAAGVNESVVADSACSWPPGMSCVPGSFKNLHILRWHCRLRKTLDASKTLWTAERLKKEVERRKRRRKKYRCIWVKVPYPVPEDCVCSC